MPSFPRRRPLLFALGVLLALLLAAAGAVALLLPSDEALARRVADKASEALGVPVAVEALHWRLLPAPRVVLEGVATTQRHPVRLDRVVIRPDLHGLIRGRFAIEHLLVEGGRFPQLAPLEWKRPARPAPASGERPVAALRFSDLIWVSRRGRALRYEGEAVFDPDWRPREAELRRSGAPTPTLLRLQREATDPGTPDRWRLQAEAGGGRGDGSASLATLPDHSLRLEARLEAQSVDPARLMAAFERKPFLQGSARTTTTIVAEAPTAGELGRRARTRTDFAMAPATLLRFDLGALVRGSNGREGQTRLDSLQGRLDTQNTPDGIVMRFSGLRARSGVLTATGELTLFDRRMQGAATVDLVGGLVGIPVRLGGSLDDPQVLVSRGALAGAAVGSALLPGIGTALGLRLGESLGRWFGDDKPAAPALPPPGRRASALLRSVR